MLTRLRVYARVCVCVCLFVLTTLKAVSGLRLSFEVKVRVRG